MRQPVPSGLRVVAFTATPGASALGALTCTQLVEAQVKLAAGASGRPSADDPLGGIPLRGEQRRARAVVAVGWFFISLLQVHAVLSG